MPFGIRYTQRIITLFIRYMYIGVDQEVKGSPVLLWIFIHHFFMRKLNLLY